MLTRMYNLAMHAKGLPIDRVPFRWMMFWSRLLEDDLMQRRLDAMTRSKKRR